MFATGVIFRVGCCDMVPSDNRLLRIFFRHDGVDLPVQQGVVSFEVHPCAWCSCVLAHLLQRQLWGGRGAWFEVFREVLRLSKKQSSRKQKVHQS